MTACGNIHHVSVKRVVVVTWQDSVLANNSHGKHREPKSTHRQSAATETRSLMDMRDTESTIGMICGPWKFV